MAGPDAAASARAVGAARASPGSVLNGQVVGFFAGVARGFLAAGAALFRAVAGAFEGVLAAVFAADFPVAVLDGLDNGPDAFMDTAAAMMAMAVQDGGSIVLRCLLL